MTGAKTPPKDTSAPVGKLQGSVGDADLLLVALQEPVSLHTDLLQNPQHLRLRPCREPTPHREALQAYPAELVEEQPALLVLHDHGTHYMLWFRLFVENPANFCSLIGNPMREYL
jgi:hypothetical protein